MSHEGWQKETSEIATEVTFALSLTGVKVTTPHHLLRASDSHTSLQ